MAVNAALGFDALCCRVFIHGGEQRRNGFGRAIGVFGEAREGLTHSVLQGIQGEVSIGVLILAAAEAAVDAASGIHEKGGPGEVEVKVEQPEVDPAHVGDPNQHEAVGEVCDLFVKTNNLLVEAFAGLSTLSAEDDEQRFLRLPCRNASRFPVGVPPGLRFLPRGMNCRPG
jgi:hypothetical protein